jgi:hypothetical protein
MTSGIATWGFRETNDHHGLARPRDSYHDDRYGIYVKELSDPKLSVQVFLSVFRTPLSYALGGNIRA